MALYRNIYGWEVGGYYGASASGNLTLADRYIHDEVAAYTGCYYGTCAKGTNDTIVLLAVNGGVGPFREVTVTSKALLRCRFRIDTAVNAANCGVMSVGSDPAPGTGCYALLQINPTNNWRIRLRASGTSAYSAAPLVTGDWNLAEITLTLAQVWNPATGYDNTETVTATVNGVTLTAGPQFSSGNFGTGFDRVILGFPTLNNAWYSFGPVPTVGTYSFDDLTYLLASGADLPSAVFPTPTRVRLVAVTGQGSLAQWTGNALDLAEIPMSPADPGQTSTVLGQTTLLSHAPVDTQLVPSLGITGAEVFKVYGYLGTTGSPLQRLWIDGTSQIVDVSASLAGGSATPFALTWRVPGDPYTDPQIDALEYGWENNSGDTLVCRAIHAEVLCELESWGEPGCGLYIPPEPPPPENPGCAVSLATGSDSAGGAGCSAALGAGSDSGGGSGCGVSLA